MQAWNVLHAACWKCMMQKMGKNSPSGHHRTILSGYIFATKARIDNRKKIIKQQYLPHMSPRYGELRPTSGWDRFISLGHPSNFNGFRLLAALLHSTVVVGVSQTVQRWTEGATIFGRRPSRWALAHILVYIGIPPYWSEYLDRQITAFWLHMYPSIVTSAKHSLCDWFDFCLFLWHPVSRISF